jgi:hypothetical protein
MRYVSFVVVLAMCCGVALGQESSFTLSTGYSNLHVAPAQPNLTYNKDGGYLDGDFSVLLPTQPRLLVGGGIGGSWHYETYTIYGPNYIIYGPSSDLGLFSLEGRIGVPISSRAAPGVFVLPRLGTGLLIDDYSIDTAFYTAYHTGFAYEVRPSLQAGYSWGFGSFGLDLSYMWAWGDFGGLGNRAQEFRVGVFFRARF